MKKYKTKEEAQKAYKEQCKNWRINHPEEVQKANKQWRQTHQETIREYGLKRREDPIAYAQMLIASKAWNKKNQQAMKLDVIQHYGGKCICCGETEIAFLTIDHINGGGIMHRKSLGGHLLRWIQKNNYPNTLQVLCSNCNLAKGLLGECPHQRDKKGK